MSRIAIDGTTYETTHRNGMPAIRSLNNRGGTLRWHGLRSEIGLAVMKALNAEPAMAPGFSTTHEGGPVDAE
jgi:hypothetical protein